MSEQYKDAHDPAISAVYRKTGDLAPPTSLDEAILATAKQAVRQRRQRWMLPMSTAAVLMMSVTLLMNMNQEWDFSGEPADSAPASAAAPQAEPRIAEKRKPASSPEPTAEDERYRMAEADVSAQQADPAAPAPGEAKTAQAATNRGLTTDTVRLSKGASAPSAGLSEPSARSKAESAGVLAFSNSFSSMADSVEREKNKKEIAAAKPSLKPDGKVLKQTVAQGAADMERAAAEVLEPKPWLEKVRKLLATGKKADAKRELESFKKRYPAYTLPDDLKSL